MSTVHAPGTDVAIAVDPASKQKKPLIRRVGGDRSQSVRHLVQFGFLGLNLWIGIEFLLWARFFETRGTTFYIERPAGVDGWLPIAGLMNLKYFFLSHQMPVMHPAAMVLVVIFLLSSLMLKKSFCAWLCPVGTVSEALWKLGRKLFRRNFALPRLLDVSLRSLKYVLLAFFLGIIASLSMEALSSFMQAPFGIIADVKMLNFFLEFGMLGFGVLAGLVLASILVQNFWCRYLCPYGALMGIVSVLSPAKIRRDVEACIDCGKCARICPSRLPVDQLIQIRSMECTACMECVAACPAENALQFALPPRTLLETGISARRWRGRTLQPRLVAAILAVVFFGLIGGARLTGHWQTNVSREIYMQLVPSADDFSH
jgi:polyferredoxin